MQNSIDNNVSSILATRKKMLFESFKICAPFTKYAAFQYLSSNRVSISDSLTTVVASVFFDYKLISLFVDGSALSGDKLLFRAFCRCSLLTCAAVEQGVKVNSGMMGGLPAHVFFNAISLIRAAKPTFTGYVPFEL